ncbi:MAG: Bug family tripartite tricarboxylate transporter substrate binding protein [Gemmatimonas sp.]
MNLNFTSVCAFAALLGTSFAEIPEAAAQGAEPGRINMVIGYEQGGGYDVYGRFVAQYLGRHMPGQPRVIPQNMPGAGSLKAANYIYNIAPKDGSTIGIVSQSIAFMQTLGQKGIQFDAPKFGWVGRVSDVVSLIAVWHTAPAQSIEETKSKQVTIAVGGALSGSVLYVSFLNALEGTKMKPISGYTSNQAHLAMERGEVDGSSSLLWSGIQAQYPYWITEHKVKFLVQVGLERHPDMKDVPLLTDLATNEENLKIFRALSSSDVMGRSVLAPPGLPAQRLEALRRGFDAMVKAPEVVEQAAKQKLDLNPLTGERLTEVVAQSMELSPETIAKIKQLAGAEN